MLWQVFTCLSLLVAASSVMADERSAHERRVFFENSSSDVACYHSSAEVVAPSTLEIASGKLPVESSVFHSPPNALRFAWRSAPGGDWRAGVKVATRYERRFEFDGDALALWCYSDDGLAPDDSPRIYLQDSTGAGVPTIRLLAAHGPLPAKMWTRIVLRLEDFSTIYRGTEDSRFDLSKLARVDLVQGLDDDAPHVLVIDDVRVVDSKSQDREPPAAPTGLTAEGQERHVDLTWAKSAEPDLVGYRIERSWDGEKFEPVLTRPADATRAVVFLGEPGKTAHFRLVALDADDNESPPSQTVAASTREFSDDELLDMVQRGCFRYYWEAANPDSGMAVEIQPGDKNLVALGASGFGVMAMMVGAEREFAPREQVAERMLKIVRYLERADRFHGVWPHFLDGRTGKVNPYFGKYDNGGDLVETAFMVQGLLAARQYFNRDDPVERELRAGVTRLWREVEWDWYRQAPDSDFLYWHWSPDHGWRINHPLIGWNETMIVYLLAIASPTHAAPPSMYYSGWAGQSETAVRYRQGWSRSTVGDHYANGNTYYGVKLDVGSDTGGELFFAQFSFLGFDPRGLRDKYTNYFENNRSLALIQQKYAIANPRRREGYGADCWGRSAGINSGGGRALPRDDNGTICTSASLGVMPYAPAESLAALEHFYRNLGPKIWGVYGFHDGFNETDEWFDEVYMGLNQAQIVVGIENHRTGLVWKHFMANPEIAPMLGAIGFERDKPAAK